MPDETGLEQMRGVLPGIPPLLEALHPRKQPLDHVRADEGVRYGDLQPHAVPNLQAAVGSLHGLNDLRHRRVYRKVFV